MKTKTDNRTSAAAEPNNDTPSPLRRLLFTVSYDGTGFLGWQYQPEGPTVQGFLEKGLAEILQEQVRLTGASRTDAGVHALGQVAHFDTGSPLKEAVIQRALNAKLPREVRVRELAEAPGDFNARYRASWKIYRYGLADPRLAEAPLLMRYHWIRTTGLDLEQIKRLAAAIIGEHDFYTFSKQESRRNNHRCRILEADWTSRDGRLYFEVKGDRFLRAMVRMLVGGMLAVADGRAGEDEFRQAVAVPGRWRRAVPAPACGLTLVQVHYPADVSLQDSVIKL